MTNEAGGAHYGTVQPWHLQRVMESSGNAFVDGRRCDVLKYAFRKKGDALKMADDLDKAAHCAKEAADALRKQVAEQGQPSLFDAKPCPVCGSVAQPCDCPRQ